jgi:uncharacterized protein (TIGR02646 family)
LENWFLTLIKLHKLKKPHILEVNEENWTNALLAREAKGEQPTETEKTRYRHPDIRSALVQETFGKCAYCESKILHVAFGDIEHIAPKSKAAANLVRWENLTLACQRCNNYKSDKEGFVDPYEQDPETKFRFLGPLILAKAEYDDASFTAACLQLNRGELFEKRKERIEDLHNKYVIWHRTKHAEHKKILERDLLDNEGTPDKEYAAIARAFLREIFPSSADRK